MNNFRIKDFMNWKVALFVFMVCISIWVGTSMRTESSFLETVGGRNAANQKLMIVDQGTGEISFVKKSLTGINQNFTKEDNEIKEALKLILGNNLKGNSSGFIKELKDSIAAEAKNSTDTYATKTYVNTELGKKQAKGNYQAAGNYVTYGEHTKYKFLVHEGGKNKYLAEDGCNNNLNENMDQGVHWCRANVPARIKIDLA